MPIGLGSSYNSAGNNFGSYRTSYDPCYGRSYSGASLGGRSRYRPRFDIGSHRPRHESSLWWANNYRPLTLYTRPKPGPGQGSSTAEDVTVDLNIDANKRDHHTDQYDVSDLILRRGQDFQLTIRLKQPFDSTKDKLRLQFVTGKEPKQTKNTLVKVPVVEQLDPTEWGAVIESDRVSPGGGAELGVRVISASDAVVGLYSLYVEVRLSEDENDNSDDTLQRYKHPGDIYIIFNAWCRDDAVFLDSEPQRQEYVLNETGRVYVGSAKSIRGRPWNFGQFEKVCFKAAMYLLEKCSLRTEALGNPTLVARALTAMTNSNDNDGGVLSGKWQGPYTGGRSPCSWNGSVTILEQYMISRREVKFGQCWVFSGLLTTLCRTLGLPGRSVTNFDSAHDCDDSMTIDNHVNWDGKPLSHMDDSIWNFHVWNEAWFKRPDLPPGNDGWQAFDSTPQESSEGRMRCGPASVNSVRDGNIFLPHDTKFIFAEVNGDRIIWMMKPNGELVAVDDNPKCVGSFISTKAVGSSERADITANYKYPEGSAQEREVVKKVSQHSTRRKALETLYKIKKSHDVGISCESETASNGDVTVVLSAKNNSSQPRHVSVVMCATARYYTGVPAEELGEKTMAVELEPGEQKDATWFYEAVSFICQLDEDATIGIYVTAFVKETSQVFTTQKVINFDKPDLELEVSSNRVKVGEQFDVVIQFKNPLDITLTKCMLNVEGPGIQNDLNIPLHRSIKPGEIMSQKVRLTPKFPGKREFIANFHSERLVGITGSVMVEVV